MRLILCHDVRECENYMFTVDWDHEERAWQKWLPVMEALLSKHYSGETSACTV